MESKRDTSRPARGWGLFRLSCLAAVALAVLFATLLRTAGEGGRQEVGTVSLAVCAGLTVLSAAYAARRSADRRRRAWTVLCLAAAGLLFGNSAAALGGSHPIYAATAFSNGAVLVALLLAIVGLVTYPAVRHRGPELVLMVLDGLIIGGAALIVLSVGAESAVLEWTAGSLNSRITALAVPVLEVTLLTVAVLLVMRSRADAPVLGLLSVGLAVYIVADLTFTAGIARGDLDHSLLLDVCWVGGLLIMAVAGCHPQAAVEAESAPKTPPFELHHTVLVFAAVTAAAVVQIRWGGGTLTTTQSVLWVLLVLAVGARQALLTVDNAGLRRGLERQVRERTQDLRRLVRQNQVLLTSVGDGIYGVDDDGRITFINPLGAEVLGFDQERLLGRRAHQEFHAPSPNGTPRPWDECYITQAIRHGTLTSSEEDEYVRTDGRVLPVEITASPLVDEDRLIGAVVVFRDVTQRREVERIKNEFLSVVSHELRTPLTSIRGALGLLAGGAAGTLEPPAQRMAGVALESSERLTRLINDILDIERIESGRLPMRVAAHEVRDLVESSVAELREMARSTEVELCVGDTSGVVQADADRIVQTLTNLISNAVKFSAPGAEVWVEAVPGGEEVLFRVRDTGRGIPEEKLERVFERFEQVDSSDSRLRGGTGLGLAISRGIVERHGGRIWAESRLGAGTTVQFTIPAAHSMVRSA